MLRVITTLLPALPFAASAVSGVAGLRVYHEGGEHALFKEIIAVWWETHHWGSLWNPVAAGLASRDLLILWVNRLFCYHPNFGRASAFALPGNATYGQENAGDRFDIYSVAIGSFPSGIRQRRLDSKFTDNEKSRILQLLSAGDPDCAGGHYCHADIRPGSDFNH